MREDEDDEKGLEHDVLADSVSDDTAPGSGGEAGHDDGPDEGDDGDGDPEEVITVQIGDEAPEEDNDDDPDLVNKLRKLLREEKRARKEAEAKTKAEEKAETKVGPEPTLASCDYDEGEFKSKWAEWNRDKAKAEDEQAKAKQAQEEADKRWQTKLERMQERKREIKVPDIDEAEDFMRDTFSVVQQGIAVQGAEDPALLMYALWKNPKKARELAAITDPVEYAFALAKTEAQLKVGKKSSAPPPERGIGGNKGTGAAVDNTLERLREKAAQTGDYTPVAEYKRKLRARADA